jgi:hypothetical protein
MTKPLAGTIPPRIRDALEETQLPWTLEIGGKHWKIKLAGRFVGILPKSKKMHDADLRPTLTTISQIRRVAREIRGSP